MDWAQIILGALAATGVAAIAAWIKRLVPGKETRPAKPAVSTDAPVVEAARVIVTEHAEEKQDEIEAALAGDSPEDALADIMNRTFGTPEARPFDTGEAFENSDAEKISITIFGGTEEAPGED